MGRRVAYLATGLMLAGLACLAPRPAEARMVCGWYAVVFCSKTEAPATAFMNKGWGVMIVTSSFKGFPPGQFCVVSGPQTKASAMRDQKAALVNGITKAASIRRACADSSVWNGD